MLTHCPYRRQKPTRGRGRAPATARGLLVVIPWVASSEAIDISQQAYPAAPPAFWGDIEKPGLQPAASQGRTRGLGAESHLPQPSFLLCSDLY